MTKRRGTLAAICIVVAAVVGGRSTNLGAVETRDSEGDEHGGGADVVNIKDFAHLVDGDDWSPAIQAAMDSVCVENGYQHGATIFFPPGTYRIDRTLYMGKKVGSYGMRLSGYNAVLLGTKKLDAQPPDYQARKKALAESKNPEDTPYLNAIDGELDFEGVYTGNPILEIWRAGQEAPVSYWQEGTSFVIEGLTFSRENDGNGVGIKIPVPRPGGSSPKQMVIRDVKVYRQNVGFLSNYCWQIRIESCSFRHNQYGIWGRSHFNAVSVINTEVRRIGKHGLVIGPNYGEWGSSSVFIAGSIFEAIRGYGIANYGGLQVVITGCYFEADGNSVGVFSKYGKTTIDTCHFWGAFGTPRHGHGTIVKGKEHEFYGDVSVVNKAHLVINSTDVVLRNNNYRQVKPMMVFGLRGRNSFDTTPLPAEGVEFADGFRVGDSYGMGVYVYDGRKKAFEFRDAFLPAPGMALQARERIEAASNQPAPAPGVHVCGVCAEPYDAKKGDPKQDVIPGTAFAALPPVFRCPACGAEKDQYFEAAE